MAHVVRDDTDRVVTVNDAPDRASQIVYLIVWIIEILLGFRLILRLLGASAASGFVSFIYDITRPLVAPFFGIFNTTVSTDVGRLELETLVAMAVYAAVGYIIAAILRVVQGRSIE